MVLFKGIRKSINKKIFLITCTTLIIGSILIYLLLIISMERVYFNYKEDEYTEKLKDLNNVNFDEAGSVFQDFITNIKDELYCIILYNNDDSILKLPFNYADYWLVEDLSGMTITKNDVINIYNEHNNIDDYMGVLEGCILFSDELFDNNMFLINIDFKDNKDCTAQIFASNKSISKVVQILKSIFPYMIIIFTIISIIISYIYSRNTTKSIIKISNKAKEINKKMDFTLRCEVRNIDEVGELSNSINNLSESIFIAINELKEINTLLSNNLNNEKEIERRKNKFFKTAAIELKKPVDLLINQITIMKLDNDTRDELLIKSLDILENIEFLVKEILLLSKCNNEEFSINLDNMLMKIQNYKE